MPTFSHLITKTCYCRDFPIDHNTQAAFPSTSKVVVPPKLGKSSESSKAYSNSKFAERSALPWTARLCCIILEVEALKKIEDQLLHSLQKNPRKMSSLLFVSCKLLRWAYLKNWLKSKLSRILLYEQLWQDACSLHLYIAPSAFFLGPYTIEIDIRVCPVDCSNQTWHEP